jgi:hypothetical protein
MKKKSTFKAQACTSCAGCGCLYLALVVLGGVFHNLSETPEVKPLPVATEYRPSTPTPRTDAERKADSAKEKADKLKQDAVNKAEKAHRSRELAAQKRQRAKQAELDKKEREIEAKRADERDRAFHGAFLLLGHRVESDEYLSYEAGEIKNVSDEAYRYVQVEIQLLDDSGAVVGSALANVGGLEPGEIWKFRALITETRATKIQIKDVVGFKR